MQQKNAERPTDIPRRLRASSCWGVVWGPRRLHCLFTPSRAILDPATRESPVAAYLAAHLARREPLASRLTTPTTADDQLGHRGVSVSSPAGRSGSDQRANRRPSVCCCVVFSNVKYWNRKVFGELIVPKV